MRRTNRIKTAVLALLCMLTGLAGCADQEQGITTDLDSSQSMKGFFVETEKGYYCSANGYLWYSDRDSVRFQKVCSRPECSHDDENCNAWMFGTDNNTHLYNGKFVFPYVDDEKNRLIIASKEPDGSRTKTLKSIELPDAYQYFGQMHGKYFVYNLVAFEENSTARRSTLYLLNLDAIKQEPKVITERIEEDDTKGAVIYPEACVRNFIFYNGEGGLYRYDIDTGESALIENYEFGPKGEYFMEDRIYGMDMEDDLYYLDLKTNEVVDLEDDTSVFGPFFSDGTYLYRLNYSYGDTVIEEEENGIYIYDMEGKRISYVKYSIPTNNMVYFAAASDKVFVFRLDAGGLLGSYSYFNKDEIKSGNISWIDMELDN